MERRYIISDASEKTGLEAHVLRYWEEELGINIPRNEMGHRYYLDEHIELFRQVKALKEQGISLKAIKNIVTDDMRINKNEASSKKDAQKAVTEDMARAVPDGNTCRKYDGDKTQAGDLIMFRKREPVKESQSPIMEDRLSQFEKIIGNIVATALRENNNYIEENLSAGISNRVIKEMDYLFRIKDEAEEERYKKFDEMLRNNINNNLVKGKDKDEKKHRRFFQKR
ncbi:helix-turn-helix domain-containing protein [Falcatimonas sp. MSJ-15]|uniref:helix-turn-helix domain-containing protein n=1 Tax=Falcatimonas sp. MSJ-15 TaxID=2841515 RepID=UPI001C107634|nr:helix-turn-helix domain-containing protein [Falcatimonas sp. MSJ-15]MBU5469227.1 helix-turn-helix domain-containing protein [Falcatimonas sp. MSJ-15]